MRYFDTHAHYWDSRLADGAGGPDADPATLFAGSVCAIVNVGTDPQTCRAAITQAARYTHMYTALGIHPSDCQHLTEARADVLDDLRTLLTAPASKAVALGEIGLDYHYPDTNRDIQQAYLHDQLELARSLDLPVVIHDREAHGDILTALHARPGVRGVLHSYSGSAEMVKELCRMGFYISFSGTVTFRNARRVAEAAAVVPESRLLMETDCPYLTPHPHRGELNHSGYLSYTNAALAQIRGISPQACAALTAENACRFFGLPPIL